MDERSYDRISVDSRDDINPEDNHVLLQKKIQKLMNLRAIDKKQIASLIHQIEIQKLMIEEKERTCIGLLKEVDLLQQKLFLEKIKNESKTPEKSQDKIPTSNILKPLPVERRAISISNLNLFNPKTVLNSNTNAALKPDEEIIARLSDEVKYFKKQHELLSEHLRKSQEEFLEQRNRLLDQEIKNKRLESEISKQRELIMNLKKSVDANMKLSKEIENCRSKILSLEKSLSMQDKNNADLSQLILSKNQNIHDLEELTEIAKNQLNEVSQSLVQALEEKERIERNCQMFKLKRIGNLGSLVVIPTLLIIRRDLQNNYILEIENYFSKITLNARDIMELSINKENRNKFSLVYRIPRGEGAVSEREEYESEDPVNAVCKAIKVFLERANFYENQLGKEENMERNVINNVPKHGGFFSELVSFFT